MLVIATLVVSALSIILLLAQPVQHLHGDHQTSMLHAEPSASRAIELGVHSLPRTGVGTCRISAREGMCSVQCSMQRRGSHTATLYEKQCTAVRNIQRFWGHWDACTCLRHRAAACFIVQSDQSEREREQKRHAHAWHTLCVLTRTSCARL